MSLDFHRLALIVLRMRVDAPYRSHKPLLRRRVLRNVVTMGSVQGLGFGGEDFAKQQTQTFGVDPGERIVGPASSTGPSTPAHCRPACGPCSGRRQSELAARCVARPMRSAPRCGHDEKDHNVRKDEP